MKIVPTVKRTWRKFYDYLRYDFKEIVFPSAMPDPPGTVEEYRKLTWREHLFVWKAGVKIFIKSFKTRDIDVEEEYELLKNPNKPRLNKETEKQEEPAKPSTLEDLAIAARAGSEHIRPALHRIYMTKASAYKDALKSFVEGYREGLTQVLNPDSTSETRSSNIVSDILRDSPGMKAKDTKTDAIIKEGPPPSQISGSETKTETKASDDKHEVM